MYVVARRPTLTKGQKPPKTERAYVYARTNFLPVSREVSAIYRKTIPSPAATRQQQQQKKSRDHETERTTICARIVCSGIIYENNSPSA